MTSATRSESAAGCADAKPQRASSMTIPIARTPFGFLATALPPLCPAMLHRRNRLPRESAHDRLVISALYARMQQRKLPDSFCPRGAFFDLRARVVEAGILQDSAS